MYASDLTGALFEYAHTESIFLPDLSLCLLHMLSVSNTHLHIANNTLASVSKRKLATVDTVRADRHTLFSSLYNISNFASSFFSSGKLLVSWHVGEEHVSAESQKSKMTDNRTGDYRKSRGDVMLSEVDTLKYLSFHFQLSGITNSRQDNGHLLECLTEPALQSLQDSVEETASREEYLIGLYTPLHAARHHIQNAGGTIVVTQAPDGRPSSTEKCESTIESQVLNDKEATRLSLFVKWPVSLEHVSDPLGMLDHNSSVSSGNRVSLTGGSSYGPSPIIFDNLNTQDRRSPQLSRTPSSIPSHPRTIPSSGIPLDLNVDDQVNVEVTTPTTAGRQKHLQVRPPKKKEVSKSSTRKEPLKIDVTLRKALQNMRVLVVDDVLVNRKVMGRRFRQPPFSEFDITVSYASSGEEALRKIEEADADNKAFDVIVMDEFLYDSGGVLLGHETVERIRLKESVGSDPERKRSMIFGCSGNLTSEDVQRFRDSGSDGFWGKPLPESHLLLEDISAAFELRDK